MHLSTTSLALCSLALIAPFSMGQGQGVTLVATVDGYADVPYSPQLVPQSGITVEAWFTYDDITMPTGWRFPTIVRQNHTMGGNEAYFLRVEAGNSNNTILRWKIETATNEVVVDWPFLSGQLISTWTHVAATYDGAFARMFIDGVEVGSNPGNGMPIIDRGNESLRIGTGSDIGLIEVWNGELDEVRLWPFARTAGEIQATRFLEFGSVPGLVSTWNLNGHFLDTSGGQHANPSGSIPFTMNTLNLTSVALPPAVAFGASTPGCLGNLVASVAAVPQVGNLDFAAMCTTAPAGALGFGMASFQSLAAPLQLFGIDVWLDPNGSALVIVPVDGLGATRMSLPIPATVTPGLQLGLQFGFIDPCGPAGVTASNALAVTVL